MKFKNSFDPYTYEPCFDISELNDSLFERKIGKKFYEMNSAVGNVLAIISDKKIPVPDSTYADSVNHYVTDIASAYDYYDGVGQVMPGRILENYSYRFGAQGSEVDGKIGGNRDQITTFYRQGNLQTGQWWSTDPKAHPSWSPYIMMNRNTVMFNDPLGDTIVDRRGRTVGVTRNEEGNLQYTFDSRYSDRQRASVESHFMKNSAPVLVSMNQSEMGWEDIGEV